MKHFLLIIAILFYSLGDAFGQYNLQPSIIMPSGYNAYTLKPGLLVEFSYKLPGQDALFEVGFTLGYTSLKPTADTFRTYAVGGGVTTQLLPGYEAVHSYSILTTGVVTDFNILKDKKFSPVVGVDFYFYTIEIAEDTYTENLEQYSTTGDDYWLVAISPHIGARYMISDKFTIAGGCGRSMSIVGTANPLAFWKPFITLSYSPE